MAVQSGTSAAIYTGNNSTVTPYPVPFSYLLASDIYVAVQQGDEDAVILAQGVDYTLTPVTDSSDNITGGEVLTVIEYDNTWTVTIFRQVSLTQLTELPEAGPISSRSLEKAYDKTTMALQQIHRRVLALEGIDDGGSVVVIPEGSTGEALQDVQTFVDATARGNAVPKRVGQLGVQLDNGSLWRSNGSGTGAWARQTAEATEARVNAVAISNAYADAAVAGAKAYTDAQLLMMGKVVQVASANTSTGGSTTVIIPIDNTIPQITEGVEYLTCSITPKNAASTLIVEFVGYMSASGVISVTGALFRDASADAIGVSAVTSGGTGFLLPFMVRAVVPASSTTATTFKFRYGPASGTAYIQRSSGGAAYSTAGKAILTVMEVAP